MKVAFASEPPLPLRIYLGEVITCAQPAILETLLGSCVAVCMRDPIAGVGGMNHILLPEGDEESGGARFGVPAMESLIRQLVSLGAERRRLEAKAFGAANVVPGLCRPSVGESNAAFVHDYLERERIALVASRLGGDQAVRVHFSTHSGRAIVQAVDGARLHAIVDSEIRYLVSRTADKDSSGDRARF